MLKRSRRPLVLLTTKPILRKPNSLSTAILTPWTQNAIPPRISSAGDIDCEAPVTFIQRVATAQRSVAAIIRGKEMGLGQPIGSAFFINPDGYLVTSARVVWEADRLKKQGVPISLSFPSFYEDTNRIIGLDSVDCDVVALDEDYDIAILRAHDLKRSPGYFELSVTAVPPGTQLAFTSYPLAQDYPATVVCRAATQLMSEPLARFLRGGTKLLGSFFLLDVPIHDGSRGTGVFLAEFGVVIGLACGSLAAKPELDPTAPPMNNKPGGFGYVRPLKRLVELLREHQVDFSEFPAVDEAVDR